MSTGETRWRVITRDDVTHEFGSDAGSRIADPESPIRRTFAWLLTRSFDDRGNLIVYDYKPEDLSDVDPTSYESHRTPRSVSANRYLTRIRYGFERPYFPLDDPSTPESWLLEMDFDYGEYDARLQRTSTWWCRPDSFSVYRSGFEIRTYRRCRRVLMFHRFPSLQPNPYLVRTTELGYGSETGRHAFAGAYLISVQQRAFLGAWNSGEETLPAIDLRYQEPAFEDFPVRALDANSFENLPVGVDEISHRWLDLDAEGVPGVLSEQGGELYYKRGAPRQSEHGIVAALEPMQPVFSRPLAALGLATAAARFLDLDGSGGVALVDLSGPAPGFHRRTDEGGWSEYKAFSSVPNRGLRDPEMKTVDLTGDGRPDLLWSGDAAYTWYESLGERGYRPGLESAKALDEALGPRVVFRNDNEGVFLADLSGDGLLDLIRVRNGDVCYWPSLGYGRFGSRVTMGSAPQFDHQSEFDPARLRLVDADGTGTTDLVYLARDGVHLFLNYFGNRWGSRIPISDFPPADRSEFVTTADLLGNGTSCLIWSSPLPGNARSPLAYVALSGDHKPHLLVQMDNGVGATTRVEYAPSTRYSLDDRKAGRAWATKLPFPVAVVSEVDTRDGPTGCRIVTRYAYHHGYFDGEEREFRGFGRVEQWDAESVPAAGGPIDLARVRTVRWFHLGDLRRDVAISRRYADEYWSGDSHAATIPDTVLADALTGGESREASRALRGKLLREEIYLEDGGAPAAKPYSVVEHGYAVRRIQARGPNRWPVFQSYASDELAAHYERATDDPRLTHRCDRFDDLGNLITSATLGYPRRPVPGRRPEQVKLDCVLMEKSWARVADHPDRHRLGAESHSRRYEVTGLNASVAAWTSERLFRILDAIAPADHLPFEAVAAGTRPQKRLVESVTTLYRSDDLAVVLSEERVESRAIVFERYKLALTDGLIASLYGDRVTADVLSREAGLVRRHGAWWIPTGRTYFAVPAGAAPNTASELAGAQQGFFQTHCVEDPFGARTTIDYDAHHWIRVRVTDPVGNETAARPHYRTLSSDLITDPNGNRVAVRFDAFARVLATFAMGKQGDKDGDAFDDKTTETSASDMPSGRFRYALQAWRPPSPLVKRGPVYFWSSRLETHKGSGDIVSWTYFDGLGREIQSKTRIEDVGGTPRYLSTERAVQDGKGNVVTRYEPFVEEKLEYQAEDAMPAATVAMRTTYDALSRPIRTAFPNSTVTQVIFTPWSEERWDQNDTVLESDWYRQRGRPDPDGPEPRLEADREKRAAWLAAKHANTPTVLHYDANGRHIATIEDQGKTGGSGPRFLETTHELDAEGKMLSVHDAVGRTIERTDYDVSGTVVRVRHMDSGERLVLTSAAGDVVRRWDSRGNHIRYAYDAARRLTHIWLEASDRGDGRRLEERLYYGDAPGRLPRDGLKPPLVGRDPSADRNLRGRLYRHYDGAGVASNLRYDFKGNLLEQSRRLAKNYHRSPDWSMLASLNSLGDIDAAVEDALETDDFRTKRFYDALNRETELENPIGGKQTTTYDKMSRTRTLRGSAPGGWNASVESILYDAKGQKREVKYGNKVVSLYRYEPTTFRLAGLVSTDASGRKRQDLTYTYDAVGNIASILDRGDAADGSADSEYQYDALDRLTLATGREHLGQVGGGLQPPRQPELRDFLGARKSHPNDPTAMGRYTERYFYDTAGNLVTVAHQALSGAWRRRFSYAEPSALVQGETSNRLSATSVPGDLPGQFSARNHYDANGNTDRMSHLPLMIWDHFDRLVATSQQIAGPGLPVETTWYTYDAAGERVRKVTEKPDANETMKRQSDWVYFANADVRTVPSGSFFGGTRDEGCTYLQQGRDKYAVIESSKSSGGNEPAIRYQLTNHLGSVVLELNEAAKELTYEEFSPFGPPSYYRQQSKLNDKRFSFTGQLLDGETGTHYFHARYYSSCSGRFLSPDPLSQRPSHVTLWNTYAYAQSNPVVFTDPLGLYTIVMIGEDAALGTLRVGHVALYLESGDDGKPAIYDPSGSYPGRGSSRPGTGRVITGSDVDLEHYYSYQTVAKTRVEIFRVETTPVQERQILANALAQGNRDLLDCANYVSGAISGVGPFSAVSQTKFPGALAKQLLSVKNVDHRSGTRTLPPEFTRASVRSTGRTTPHQFDAATLKRLQGEMGLKPPPGENTKQQPDELRLP